MTNEVKPNYSRYASSVDAIKETNARIFVEDQKQFAEINAALKSGDLAVYKQVIKTHKANAKKKLNSILQNLIIRNLNAVDEELLRMAGPVRAFGITLDDRWGKYRPLSVKGLASLGHDLVRRSYEHQREKYGIAVDWKIDNRSLTGAVFRNAYNEASDSVKGEYQIETYCNGYYKLVGTT